MTGLIIEGGARRGIFTAGITDCLLENKVHFDYLAGDSAGAEVALDFTAKQEDHSRRVIMPHRTGNFSVLGFLSMDLDNMIYDLLIRTIRSILIHFLRQIQTAIYAGNRLRNRQGKIFFREQKRTAIA